MILVNRPVRCAFLSFALVLTAFVGPARADDAVKLKLNQGDHIVLIGNTLAERMQEFNHFESLLHAAFPQHQLVVRNLGFSADEVRFRPRSLNFGDPDQHLSMQKADVVFAFFGFNESFGGPSKLATFEAELDNFIKHTLAQKYNGKSAARLVLFSPIAHEDLEDADFPNGKENNENIALYTKSMKGIAAKYQVPFVDLFRLSSQLMSRLDKKLTFNGVHLTDYGYQQLAPVLVQDLFGSAPASSPNLEKLQAEVAEKNFFFFHRYRAVNGYYIYGGRSQRPNGNPPFTDAYVQENERGKLDDMVAIRDNRVWKVARGESVSAKIDDSKTRPLMKVPTNFKQEIVIHPPQEAMKFLSIAKGYQVNLFASEVEFPELENPVQLTFDSRGRMWVAIMPDYPHFQPPSKPNDKLLIFEDTDGDGRADKQTVFADGLHVPTGFELGDGGAYVSQQPNVVFLKDTDGDDKADIRKTILHGFDSGDSHHSIGAFNWGPGGGIYMHEGTFHHTQVETPYGPVRNAHGGVYRFDPTKQQLETFVTYNFANPWGHCFDRWGQNFVADASGGANYYGTAFSMRAPQFTGQPDFGPFKFVNRKRMKQFIVKRVRPTAGCEIVSSRHFPPEAQGNFLLNNCIGFQGVLQHKVSDEGSGFKGVEIEPILFSSDRNFRPVDLQFGPDGALYIVDWFNPLIGHMQHNLRDPNRDHTHGRIWRITYPSRPLVKPPKIEGQSIAGLLDLLDEYEDRTRERVRLELREHPTDEVVAALKDWIASLDQDAPDYQHLLLEALWIHQHHNAVNVELLTKLLRSPDYRARAAATRVLCFWRDQVPDSLELLRIQAKDTHPRVRLETVRACSFFENAAAAEIALSVLKQPMDDYLVYTLGETIHMLEPYWKPAVGSGKPFAPENPAATEYILESVETSDLVNMARSEPVYRQLLTRHGIVHQYRQEALEGLAKLHKSDVMSELLESVKQLDRQSGMHADHVLTDMAAIFAMQPAGDLTEFRDPIQKLAKSAKRAVTRQVAYVALISADGSTQKVWNNAVKNESTLSDALNSVSLIKDAKLKESLYEQILPIVNRLPDPLNQKLKSRTGTPARYVRIELPGRNRGLTLAEVEVFSGGNNVARKGKAKQSSTSFGGVASRAIDGNTSGTFNDNGQTHTSGKDKQTWWELDLGGEVSIESIKIWTRSENKGQFVNRLDRFALKVLNSNRDVVFEKKGNKAPKENISFAIQSNTTNQIRRSAIAAVSYIPGHESETFGQMAPLVSKRAYRAVAVTSIGRLSRAKLPRDKVRPVIDELVTYIESVPVKQRTKTETMDAIQLAKDLSALLPKADAKALRRKLSDLAVDVIVIRPVPHRMQYDRTNVYVQAGKPVEIVFANVDIMPHNLIITAPGAREEVGILAEKLGATPAGFGKQFIPDSNKVLHATKMVQSGQQDRLQITAPSAIGDYPFVCTFPGHWRTMYGTLHVVEDITEVPLEKMEPTSPVEDATRRFVRKWSLGDLEPAFAALNSGRSFDNGKRLFKAVSCVACHQMKGEGGKIGPDLTEVSKKLASKKLNRVSLLTEMLMPSKVIDKKYRTQIIVNEEGKLFAGVVVHEDDTVIRLAPNPLDKKVKVVEIEKDVIVDQTESKVSLMPDGLLNTMTKNEILDLVAYIIAAGDVKHPAYKK